MRTTKYIQELCIGSQLTQQPVPTPLSAPASGGLQSAGGRLQSAGDTSSGDDDVVCTSWLRKSPPEKKLRLYA
ncbi:hypothetical protein A6R68_11554 [Neotoma lepida]|uniref:Uncharacterized protein n=1 Tax=Neotoma lepida TaxID=56216 RepID=A0A1A6FUS3_NEOLE|nr:hypothetical protein A6R68_11554 [Neotoma lepida]